MKKSNISKIIKMFLSARFPSETEEKVQKWIIKDQNQQAKAKASLDYWNELDVEADSSTYVSLERVNLRTGYNKEHLTNGYTAPEDACNSYRLVLQQLKAFEEALHQHIHLENNIVFPRSIKMEAKLREQP